MKTTMHFRASSHLFGFAKEMRRHPTKAEELLWSRLRGNQTGYKFRRQHPLTNYVVDFYCHALRLIIEVDGEIHLDKTRKLEDEDKDISLEECGYNILRFTNEAVLNDIEFVMNQIHIAISTIRSVLIQKNEEDIGI